MSKLCKIYYLWLKFFEKYEVLLTLGRKTASPQHGKNKVLGLPTTQHTPRSLTSGGPGVRRHCPHQEDARDQHCLMGRVQPMIENSLSVADVMDLLVSHTKQT